jgi:hypothetical protein
LLVIGGADGDQVRISAEIRSQIALRGTATLVDAVPYPTNQTPLKLASDPITVPASGFAHFVDGKECPDPRFNWAADNPASWVHAPTGPESTLGTTNYVTTLFLNMVRANPNFHADWDMAMYVSDRGHLVSAGELGNLLRSGRAPQDYYKTIRIFDHAYPPGAASSRDGVLYHFTAQELGPKRGLVNINSPYKEVLQCAFDGAPLGYPESTEKLTAVAAEGIANSIATSGIMYTNVADIGKSCQYWDWRTLLPGMSDIERESVISHSYQLFGTRHNLFVIFVASGPYAPGVGKIQSHGEVQGEWLGYRRAIAVVWRDPFPDADGKHPCFVQAFRWLEGGD